MSDYWLECVEAAFNDASLSATKEQMEIVAGAFEGCHENYGMAQGHDSIPNPYELEVQRLKRELEAERSKVACGECNGSGWITTHSTTISRSATSQCWKCHGEGRIAA